LKLTRREDAEELPSYGRILHHHWGSGTAISCGPAPAPPQRASSSTAAPPPPSSPPPATAR